MSQVKDPLFRYLAILQLIPRLPGRISTPSLQEKLKDRGFNISLRSLQRDLRDKLSASFAIVSHEEERPFRWSLDGRADIDLRSPDPASALALSLAEGHLSCVLPPSVMDQLAPQFRAADNYLNGLENNGLAHWRRRVRSIPNGKALYPADIDAQVWVHVSQALVDQCQLRVHYMSRSKGEVKCLDLNPIGLVSRHSINYLVAGVVGYADLRHFALHRIQHAALLDTTAQVPDEFDMDDYVASGVFASRQPLQTVELVADIHPQVAWLLNETPLSRDQHITPLAGTTWSRLQAQVPQDDETLWWIFGLNTHIRVHAPQAWVEQITSALVRTRELYPA
ncbi:helix-turn-helix transcriptional regulator [Pseudomonas capeferrum]|jgi:predicted DNA-binding transcriptional regulator YafY